MRNESKRAVWRRRIVGLGLAGACFQFGLLGSLDDKFIGCTRYFDPCGTIFANCQPGDFITNAADVGDYCIDPTCTVPGGCGNEGPALGTVTELCP